MELLTFINTTLDLDQNFLNGVSPYLFISANVTIDHFVAKNRGFYSCVTNTSSTKSSLRTLLTSSELKKITYCYIIAGKHEVNITDLIQERLGNSIYTTVLAQYAGIPERLLQWYVNGKPVGPSNTVFNVKYDGLNSCLRFKHDVNQTYGTFMSKLLLTMNLIHLLIHSDHIINISLLTIRFYQE